MQTYMSPQEVRQDLPRGRVVCILSWPFQPERAQARVGMHYPDTSREVTLGEDVGRTPTTFGLASAALAARRQLYMTQNTATNSVTILTHQIAMHHKNKNFIILRSRIIKFLLPINNKLNLLYNSENQWKDARWDQQIAIKNSSTKTVTKHHFSDLPFSIFCTFALFQGVKPFKISTLNYEFRAFLMFFLFTTN